MIGHCTHFQENDNLPFWQDPAINKKAPFFNVLRWSCVKLCAVGLCNTILENGGKYHLSNKVIIMNILLHVWKFLAYPCATLYIRENQLLQ